VADFVTSATPVDEAAQRLAAWLEQARQARGTARLGLAGGSAVAVLPRAKALLSAEAWRAVLVTWVDERVVPTASPDSNRGAAERAGALEGLGGVLPMVEDGEAGPAACARFEREFRERFDGALDVALLGMGEDGHVASLFPGHRLLDASGLVAHLDDSPKPPPARVTLTLPVLAAVTTRRLVLATGAGKLAALRRLAANDVTIPVARLGAVTVVTDQTLT
jgi:6-phosphogluconolactonase